MLEKVESFFSHYPKKLKELLRFLGGQNLELYLVGGSVRDFLDTGKFGTDHDFEIQSSADLSAEEWKVYVDEVMDQAADKFQLSIEKLKFNIHRLSFTDGDTDYDLEFAPARLELYDTHQKVYGHSDFKVQLLAQLSVHESWSRRDFSVNAMGFYFNLEGPRSKLEFIDPFNGLQDLKQRVLRPVGADFHRDPVRFVRSLRFSRKLKMKFGEHLKKQLALFNLQRLSPESLKREALKDGAPVDFLKQFFRLAKEHRIELPSDALDLKAAVEKLTDFKLDSFNRPGIDLGTSLLWNPKLDWSELEFLSFTLFWGGKKKEVSRHFKVYEILVSLPEDLLSLDSVDSLRRHSHYGQLKKLLGFFESDSWPRLCEKLPEKTSYFWPPRLKSLNSLEFKQQAKEKTRDVDALKKAEQKLYFFLTCLRG